MIYYNIYDMIWHKLKETKFDNLLKIYQQYFTRLQIEWSLKHRFSNENVILVSDTSAKG